MTALDINSAQLNMHYTLFFPYSLFHKQHIIKLNDAKTQQSLNNTNGIQLSQIRTHVQAPKANINKNHQKTHYINTGTNTQTCIFTVEISATIVAQAKPSILY